MKKKFLFLIIIVMCIGAAACGTSDSDGVPQADSLQYYEGNLTEEEISQTHLSLHLMEDVTVDADITPYKEYREGLSSYYIDDYPEAEMEDPEADYRNNPVLFQKNLQEVLALLETENGGSFLWEERKLDFSLLGVMTVIPYQCSSEKELQLRVYTYWNSDKSGFHGSEIYLEDMDFTASSAASYGKRILSSKPLYEKKDISGLDTISEAEHNIRSFLTDFLDCDLAETCVCIPVDQALFEEVAALYGESKPQYVHGDYYMFMFYHSVDGFPWKTLAITRDAGEVEYAEKLESQVSDGLLFPCKEYAQIVLLDADGIEFMQTDKFMRPVSCYQEQKPVVPLEEILTQVQAYFGEMLLVEPVTVYEIELFYASSFSAEEDGPLQNIVSPFWAVKYWDGIGDARELIYDAYTGEFIFVN